MVFYKDKKSYRPLALLCYATPYHKKAPCQKSRVLGFTKFRLLPFLGLLLGFCAKRRRKSRKWLQPNGAYRFAGIYLAYLP